MLFKWKILQQLSGARLCVSLGFKREEFQIKESTKTRQKGSDSPNARKDKSELNFLAAWQPKFKLNLQLEVEREAMLNLSVKFCQTLIAVVWDTREVTLPSIWTTALHQDHPDTVTEAPRLQLSYRTAVVPVALLIWEMRKIPKMEMMMALKRRFAGSLRTLSAMKRSKLPLEVLLSIRKILVRNILNRPIFQTDSFIRQLSQTTPSVCLTILFLKKRELHRNWIHQAKILTTLNLFWAREIALERRRKKFLSAKK